MVLTSTQMLSNDKENLLVKAFVPQEKRDPKARRHHFRLRHTGSHATREAARRIRHSAPVTPHAHTLALSIEDDGFREEPPVNTVSPGTSPQRKVSLPRHLRRPAYRGIAPAALSAIDPDLAEVPIEYIHQELHNVAEQMRSAAAKIVAKCPKGRLPHELEVVINDLSADVPTHVVAVYSQPSSGLQKWRVTLHPVHALVLSAQCANLPPLPRSNPSAPESPGGTVTLPVLPLCVSSPDTFPILLNYLYTRRADLLLASLLPLPAHDLEQSTPTSEQLSRKLAETFTVPALLAYVSRTHGLWNNTVALGVFDEKLWSAIDVAWEILLGALAASTGETWTSQGSL